MTCDCDCLHCKRDKCILKTYREPRKRLTAEEKRLRSVAYSARYYRDHKSEVRYRQNEQHRKYYWEHRDEILQARKAARKTDTNNKTTDKLR